MTQFDPNAAASADSGIFGLPFTPDQAKLVYLPVPWEATTSYGGGTSNGPAAIIEASRQVDLYDGDVVRPYEAGLAALEIAEQVGAWNSEAKDLAQGIIEVGGEIAGNTSLAKDLTRVNLLCDKLNDWVYEQTKTQLKKGKLVALIGGDHATPLGAFQAIGEKEGSFGILHFDAHSDTRIAYEGFTFSHASIMYNALERIPEIQKLVQVGIRDYCEQEVEYCKSQGDRVKIFFDRELSYAKFEGRTFAQVAESIVSQLPQKVWVSFDIDGLDPRFCPNTGTPVPGGLEFNEANFILRTLVKSGRKIVGFDLNEVSLGTDPELTSDWDANVGARLLYKLTAWTLASQGLAKLA